MNAPGFTAERSLLSVRGHSSREWAEVVGVRVEPAARLSRGGGGAIGSRLGFVCGGLACSCSGDADCNDLFSTGLCGDIATCYVRPGGGVTCACLRL